MTTPALAAPAGGAEPPAMVSMRCARVHVGLRWDAVCPSTTRWGTGGRSVCQ